MDRIVAIAFVTINAMSMRRLEPKVFATIYAARFDFIVHHEVASLNGVLIEEENDQERDEKAYESRKRYSYFR